MGWELRVVGGVLQVVASVFVHVVGLDQRGEDRELVVRRLPLQRAAERRAFAVLDLAYDRICPVEQELVVLEFVSPWELRLEGSSLVGLQDGLHSAAGVVDGLVAEVAAFVGGEEHLLVEFLEIGQGVDDSAGSDGPDGQVRVFVAVPGGKGARVGPSDRNPGVVGHLVGLGGSDLLREIGEVLQGLLGVEQPHVLQGVGVDAEGQRSSVEAVLQHQDESLEALRHGDDPLPGGRHSLAGVLPADEEEDGSHVGVEEILNGPVALLPDRSGLVVVVVEHLRELVLFLGEHHGVVGLCGGVDIALPLLVGCHQHQQQHGQQQLHVAVDRFIITPAQQEKNPLQSSPTMDNNAGVLAKMGEAVSSFCIFQQVTRIYACRALQQPQQLMPPKKRRAGTAHPDEHHDHEHRLETKPEELKTAPDNERSETDSSQQRPNLKQPPLQKSTENSRKTEEKEGRKDQTEAKQAKTEPSGPQGKKRTFEEAGGVLNSEQGEKGQKKLIRQNGRKKEAIVAGETVDDPEILEMRMKKFGTSAGVDEGIPAIYREALPVRHERKASKHKRHPTRPIKRRHSFRDNRDNRDNREKRQKGEKEEKKEEAGKPQKGKEVKDGNQLPPLPKRSKPKRQEQQSQSINKRHHSPDRQQPRREQEDRQRYERERYERERYERERYEQERYERDRYARDRYEDQRYRREDRYRSERSRNDSRRFSPPPPPRRPSPPRHYRR